MAEPKKVAGTGRSAPIVADLGRPETPEETAARKAETSRKHRANQTLRNLVWSLVATLIVVLLLVLVVVRPDPVAVGTVDYRTVAEQAQVNVDEPLATPDLGSTWTANTAELRTRGEVTSWYVGFITPKSQFIAMDQGIEANPTWVDNTLDGNSSNGAVVLSGVTWDVYDYRDAEDPGNLAYAMVAVDGDSTYVLYGTASDEEFASLAKNLTSEFGAN